MKNQEIPYKIYLSESEMPEYWYNVRAGHESKARAAFEPSHTEAYEL